LSRSVEEGVRTEGRRLMAADIAVEGRRPLPKELEALLARQPAATRVERTDVREFVSVVRERERRSDAAGGAEGRRWRVSVLWHAETRSLEPEIVRVARCQRRCRATELLSKLNAKIGDELRIGGADFRIAGAVLEEPDKLSITFTLGPRVFMSSEGVGRTALLDKGARVEYRALLKMPDGSSAGDVSRLASLIEASSVRRSSIASARSAMPSRRCGAALSGWGGTSESSGCCRCSSAAWASLRWRGRG
jgi:putative ABC transport system permease protein